MSIMYGVSDKIQEVYEDDVWCLFLGVKGGKNYGLDWRDELTMTLRRIEIYSLTDLFNGVLYICEGMTEKECEPIEDEVMKQIM